MIKRIQAGPRMSQAVVHEKTVYISGQVSDSSKAPIGDQTGQVLAKIEKLLHAAGTDKSRLLSVTMFLPHIADFDSVNNIYDNWIDKANPPARACVEARLADPDLRIEIAAIAALL